jgi:uncharacterized protein (DUF302 family)
MKYGYTKAVDSSVSVAIEALHKSLASEGFGILSEIDVQATLKKKLGVEDFDEYVILGACNPGFAYEALQSETEIGLLLPCNLIVYRKDDRVYISTMLPSVAMSVIDNQSLSEIASEVELKLKRVVDSV